MLFRSRVLATEERADGAADNVAAAENDGVLAGDLDAGRLEQEHDSGRGAGREQRCGRARREEADVVGVEAAGRVMRCLGHGLQHCERTRQRPWSG